MRYGNLRACFQGALPFTIRGMIKCKICMLGAFAVGKTSLVRQFVSSMFSEKYHTTVGVKIDKKIVMVGETEVDLIIWDIQGEEVLGEFTQCYLRGAAGCLLVADGTRPGTLSAASSLRQQVADSVGKIPSVLLLNKADMIDEWAVGEAVVSDLASEGWQVLRTSAKTGIGVEEAFACLARQVMRGVVAS